MGGPLYLEDFTSEPYPVVMLPGLVLPSKPRRILTSTHGGEQEGPLDPQSDLGSPFRMLLDLGQVWAWVELTCRALTPVCGEKDSFSAETSGVTPRTYLYTFTRASGDSHA